MKDLLSHPLFGLVLTILTYQLGIVISRRVRSPFINPYLISVASTIVILLATGITLDQYMVGGNLIGMFLSPATAVLAVSIYRQKAVLQQYFWPLTTGCLVGSIISMTSVVLICRLFDVEKAVEAALIPKSVTTAIAIEIARSRDGIVAITIVSVLITGMVGAILAPKLIKWLRIDDPVVAGVAIGTSSHAIGTTKAIELGEVQGAMSGLSIGIAGLLTALLTIFF